MRPLAECSTSVDSFEGFEEMEAWGGALADFRFFGPEMDTNAVRMEPFGSCALEVLL
jgi:hypothetical protein